MTFISQPSYGKLLILHVAILGMILQL